MLSLLLIIFIFAAVVILFSIAVVGVILFRKKSAKQNARNESNIVIDVTPKDVQ